MGLQGLVSRPPAVEGTSADDDLTSLAWLQDRDLLRNVTARTRLLTEQNENNGPGTRGVQAVVPPVAYDPRVHVHTKPPHSFSSLIRASAFLRFDLSFIKLFII